MTTLKNRLDAYEQMLRLHQPTGALLLLWPTLSALWLATGGRPPLSLVIVFVMGTLLMRSAACVLNDWLHRDSNDNDDAEPLKQGVIAPWEALALAAVLTLIAFCFVWFTTKLAIGMAAAALALALALAFLQLFSKCFFSLPQALLGIVFLFGIPIAFAAANSTVPWVVWGLMGVHVFWVGACDIGKAMANRDRDSERGRCTSALILGRYDVLAAAACYGLYLAGMIGAGLWWRLGIVYWIALALAAACVACGLWFVRHREASRCFAVFRHNHGIVMLVFIGVAADYALRLQAWPVPGS